MEHVQIGWKTRVTEHHAITISVDDLAGEFNMDPATIREWIATGVLQQKVGEFLAEDNDLICNREGGDTSKHDEVDSREFRTASVL